MLISILFIFFYLQFGSKKNDEAIEYNLNDDIINPKFVKEKKNKDRLEVVAKKASFLQNNEIFLEGNVKYFSNNFTLQSDKVNFDQLNFNASSNQKTTFKSKNIIIASEGFFIKEKGNIISFNGKSKIEIK